jgi:hypothetical protein
MRGDLQAKLSDGTPVGERDGPSPGRCLHWTQSRELIAVVRQEKPGVSYRVEVPVGQGLASHPYRALRLPRRRRRKEGAAERSR